MGVDVMMYFKTADGAEPSELWLPEGWSLHEPPEREKEVGATHEISTGSRYYGPHYERGHWPTICGVLMSAFASPNVERVWYFGDHSWLEGMPPISVDEVLEISRHYMANGHRPYRAGFQKINQST